LIIGGLAVFVVDKRGVFAIKTLKLPLTWHVQGIKKTPCSATSTCTRIQNSTTYPMWRKSAIPHRNRRRIKR
jgi:hypothetical protein